MIFASWAAGGFGQVGSTEWVESQLPKLKERAVGYVNVDFCVAGRDFKAQASSPLKEVVVKAMQYVQDPDDETHSCYDTWNKKQGSFNRHNVSQNESKVIGKTDNTS